ncbi:hypothetical protein [Acinetobacter haemolyticus]|uniref:Uncharacterized protein n=1 Tax=Acinetobacter haemolyticus TaxID=29430 RepID=A0A857IHH0_ACIHA|nr:hypothetical protein [Acinetobacter haemolyticus]ENW21660.1 hypothetical protein F926_00946 [Acinetobacter haemolyticus NIPH 261]QHI09246.1 hypothetical protein AhaeAN59_03525 [Acinetobacter haemolyticus]QHI12507.1 hypothetical protein AhaeAN43_03465 [Acinetobacter haemolyticus]
MKYSMVFTTLLLVVCAHSSQAKTISVDKTKKSIIPPVINISGQQLRVKDTINSVTKRFGKPVSTADYGDMFHYVYATKDERYAIHAYSEDGKIVDQYRVQGIDWDKPLDSYKNDNVNMIFDDRTVILGDDIQHTGRTFSNACLVFGADVYMFAEGGDYTVNAIFENNSNSGGNLYSNVLEIGSRGLDWQDDPNQWCIPLKDYKAES